MIKGACEMKNRKKIILEGITQTSRVMEVAPYFNPAVLKSEMDVFYVDYLSTEQLREKAADNPVGRITEVPEIDFVWVPGKKLAECIPEGMKFDYVIASHVLEHVPNPIGWIEQIIDVMPVGGVLTLALPDSNYTMDYFRKRTTLGDLIGVYIEDRHLPTAGQVMDFLSDSFYDSRLEGQGRPIFDGKSLSDFERHYSDKEAFDLSLWTYNELKYIDIHASVFTPESFKILFERISALHLLPIVVSDPIKLNHENKNATDFDRDEFIVRLEKTNQKKLDFPKRQGFENFKALRGF
jgi:hypothetical protein